MPVFACRAVSRWMAWHSFCALIVPMAVEWTTLHTLQAPQFALLGIAHVRPFGL